MTHGTRADAAAGEAATVPVELLYAEAADHLLQGIAIFDADLRLRFANRRAFDLLDIPPHLRVVGTPFEAFIRLNAERGEYGPGTVEAQVAERLAQARRFEAHEFDRDRPDGTVLRVVGRPLPSGGFVSTWTDITQRIRAARDLEALNRQLDEKVAARTRELAQANAALEQRSAFLQALVDQMPVGVTAFDEDLRLIVANDLFRINTDVPKSLCQPGTPFEDCMRYNAERGEYGPGDVETLVAQRVALARKMEAHHFIRRRQDGAYIEVRGAPLAGGGFVTTYADVTDRERMAVDLRQAKEDAERANRTKSDFLANMSHELRTPLNAIIGFADMIQKAVFGPHATPRYAEYGGHIASSGQHLLQLINDILDISAVEAGKLTLCEEDVAVSDLVEAALVLVSQRAANNGVRLVSPDGPLPVLRADRRRLLQVLVNLLGNAVKFTPRGGEVRLEVEALPDGAIAFRVIDTGIGIARADLDRVMEPFAQADSGHARRAEGAGLGLPLSRDLMHLHGGSLRVDSILGQGTTATATLPAGRLRQG